jgi:hypothetical protein
MARFNFRLSGQAPATQEKLTFVRFVQSTIFEHEDSIHPLRNRVIVSHDNEAGLQLLIQLEHKS